jgi:hypothetical protein
MKNNTKEPQFTIIDASKLVIDGVYFNSDNELVQIKDIDTKKKEIFINNISEQFTMHVKFDRHNLVKRIR